MRFVPASAYADLPGNFENHFILALCAIQLGYGGVAEATVDRLIECAPNEPRYLTLKASAIINAMDHKRFTEAANLTNRARALDPAFAYADRIQDKLARMNAFLEQIPLIASRLGFPRRSNRDSLLSA